LRDEDFSLIWSKIPYNIDLDLLMAEGWANHGLNQNQTKPNRTPWFWFWFEDFGTKTSRNQTKTMV
jgi:hypothetical protein